MKSLMYCGFLLSCLSVLTACGSGADTARSNSSTTVETSASSSIESSQEEMTQSIFTGIISEDAKKNETDDTIRLVIQTIEIVEDPEEIAPTMQESGVILNASDSQLADGVTMNELKKGTKIQFTLQGLPIMTMSIPPQIAGNSLSEVVIVE